MPDDQREFERFLANSGSIRCYSPASFSKEDDIRPVDLDDFETVLFYERVYLTLAEFENGIVKSKRHSEGPLTQWGIDLAKSPVVSYTIGVLDGENLPLSTLSFSPAFPQSSTMATKSEDFLHWGNKVLTWVRRHTPYSFQYKKYRATERVKEAVEANRVNLRPY